jgi:hypothetical protein
MTISKAGMTFPQAAQYPVVPNNLQTKQKMELNYASIEYGKRLQFHELCINSVHIAAEGSIDMWLLSKTDSLLAYGEKGAAMRLNEAAKTVNRAEADLDKKNPVAEPCPSLPTRLTILKNILMMHPAAAA